MALFGPSSGRREPRSLVEFRAGKMELNGRMVTPDKRKGLVYLKLDESQVLHFYWKDRTTGIVDDDFMIMQDEATFKRVSQCTTGRVFVLRFKNSSRKFFYWMQEPKDDKDEEICKKISDLFENPREAVQNIESGGEMGGMSGLPGIMGLDNRSLQSVLRNFDQQQLMELLGNQRPEGLFQALSGGSSPSRPSTRSGGQSRPDTAASETSQSQRASGSSSRQQVRSRSNRSGRHRETSSSSSHRRVQLADLQSILSAMPVPESVTEGGGGASGGDSKASLSEAITSDALRELATDTESSQQLQPHLPQTNEDTATLLTSPQFRQALDVFGAAFGSGQLGPLVTQFGLGQGPATAAATGNAANFAEALEKELKGETGQSEERGVASGASEEEDKKGTPNDDMETN